MLLGFWTTEFADLITLYAHIDYMISPIIFQAAVGNEQGVKFLYIFGSRSEWARVKLEGGMLTSNTCVPGLKQIIMRGGATDLGWGNHVVPEMIPNSKCLSHSPARPTFPGDRQ